MTSIATALTAALATVTRSTVLQTATVGPVAIRHGEHDAVDWHPHSRTEEVFEELEWERLTAELDRYRTR